MDGWMVGWLFGLMNGWMVGRMKVEGMSLCVLTRTWVEASLGQLVFWSSPRLCPDCPPGAVELSVTLSPPPRLERSTTTPRVPAVPAASRCLRKERRCTCKVRTFFSCLCSWTGWPSLWNRGLSRTSFSPDLVLLTVLLCVFRNVHLASSLQTGSQAGGEGQGKL